MSQFINLDRTVISSWMGVGDGGGRHEEGGVGVVTLEAASGTGSLMEREMVVLGMKDPDSTGARRVVRSSGRLTRTVALVKSKYITRIVSAY